MEIQGCRGEVSQESISAKGSTGYAAYTDTCDRLEERRKVKGAAYYDRKKAVRKQLSQATKNAKVDDKVKKQLAQYGY